MENQDKEIRCPKCNSVQLTAINSKDEILVCCIACGEKWKPSEYWERKKRLENIETIKANQKANKLLVDKRRAFIKLYQRDKISALTFAKENMLAGYESGNVESIYKSLKKQEVKEFVSQLIGVTFAVLIVILFLWMCSRNDDKNSDSSKSEYSNPISNVYSNPAEKWMSGIDGSIFDFEWKLKRQLHDPDSFEHVETSYKGDGYGEYVEVKMLYRAKNKMGTLVLNSAKAILNTNDGSISGITVE